MQEQGKVDDNVLIQGDEYEPDQTEGSVDGLESKTFSSKFADNPEFMRRLPIIIIGGIVVIMILVGGYFLTTGGIQIGDKGIDETPDFLKELEEGGYDFLYTQEEVEELRAYGYTGTEIEEFEQQQIFSIEKIEEAKRIIQDRFNVEVAPMLDGASDEYKKLEKDTWIGGMQFDQPADPAEWTYHAYELNADYERLPARGNQLFLKIYLTSGEPAFINVGPELYYGLRDVGNIVVHIEYTDVTTQKLITSITVIK